MATLASLVDELMSSIYPLYYSNYPSGGLRFPVDWPTSSSDWPIASGAGRIVSTAGTANGTTMSAAGRSLDGSRVSPGGFMFGPIAGSATISGSITFNVYAYENDMKANATIHFELWRIPYDGGTPWLIIDSTNGVELSTTVTAQNWSDTPTSTAMVAGDSILGVVSFNGASGYSATHQFGGTAGSNYDTYISFTESLSLMGDPSGSYIEMGTAVSDVDAGVDERVMWIDGYPASFTPVVTYPVNGPVALPGTQATFTGGGTAVEWYTPQLQAFTLSGGIDIGAIVSENEAAANASLVHEVLRTDSDGSNPTLYGRVRHCTTLGAGTDELPTAGGGSAFVSRLGGPDLAVADGQRLLLRARFADSVVGGTMAASGQITISLVQDAYWLDVPQTLTEYSAGAGSLPPIPPRFHLIRR